MIKLLLQGKPFGHPVHPALVHFPIGLFIPSRVLDVLSRLSHDPTLMRAANYAMAGGVVMALLAAVPGLVDYADIRADHPAKKVATTHLLLNIAAVALFAATLVLRSKVV